MRGKHLELNCCERSKPKCFGKIGTFPLTFSKNEVRLFIFFPEEYRLFIFSIFKVRIFIPKKYQPLHSESNGRPLTSPYSHW